MNWLSKQRLAALLASSKVKTVICMAAVRANHVLLKFEFDKVAGTWSNRSLMKEK